jgi:GNAT superfamily N-acetyltransferase
MVVIDFSDLEIKRLDDTHDVSNFECDIEDLNEFLIEKSHHQMRNRWNVTFVCLYQSIVVAYFTWCADSIRVKELEKEDKEDLKDLGIIYNDLPALKLCRLAVDKKYEGNRIGPGLVELTIANARYLSKIVGVRFITVDAYFMNKWLYEKYKFKISPKEKPKLTKYARNPKEDHTISMYKDIHID